MRALLFVTLCLFSVLTNASPDRSEIFGIRLQGSGPEAFLDAALLSDEITLVTTDLPRSVTFRRWSGRRDQDVTLSFTNNLVSHAVISTATMLSPKLADNSLEKMADALVKTYGTYRIERISGLRDGESFSENTYLYVGKDIDVIAKLNTRRQLTIEYVVKSSGTLTPTSATSLAKNPTVAPTVERKESLELAPRALEQSEYVGDLQIIGREVKPPAEELATSAGPSLWSFAIAGIVIGLLALAFGIGLKFYWAYLLTKRLARAADGSTSILSSVFMSRTFVGFLVALIVWVLFGNVGLVTLVVLALLYATKSRVFKGSLGEWVVNTGLKIRLDPKEYTVVKDVLLPLEDGGTTQIDHIVVSTKGIFVIETKNMSGWIFGSENQKQWTQQIFRYKGRFQNPIHQNWKHVKVLEKILDVSPSAIHSVIVFLSPAVLKTPLPDNVTVDSGSWRYIKSFTEDLLTPEQAEQCIASIDAHRLSNTWQNQRRHNHYVESLRMSE